MSRQIKALPFILAAASITICAYAAEPTITEEKPVGMYSSAAKRVSYSGETAQFSLDIFGELFPEICTSEPLERDDGSIEYELFYAEDISPYISCCLHESEGGYADEMSAWQEMAEDGESKLEIFTRTDLDGSEFSIVDLHFEYSEDNCTDIIIAEYPLNNGEWLNVSYGAEHLTMDSYRDDIYAMLETFSKAGDSVPKTTDEAESDSPNTGVGIPAAVIAAAVIAAAVMAASAGRKSRGK